MRFRARQFVYERPRPRVVRGVVSVTPDSFAEGVRPFAPDRAPAHARACPGIAPSPAPP